MLKIIGAVLVIFACAALGYKKSAAISDRLFLLREIEKLLLLLMGEITYRREALPEAVLRVSGKVQEPLCSFFERDGRDGTEISGRAFCLYFSGKCRKIFEKQRADAEGF